MINNDNGLPAEIRKFMEVYLHTEAERKIFLAEYNRLANERERQAFLARYAEPPDDDLTTAEAHKKMEETIELQRKSKQN